MADEHVDALKERFARDGQLEFQVSPVKVFVHLMTYLLLATVFPPLVAVTWSAALRIPALVLIGCVLLATSIALTEQIAGAGPALRMDQDGLVVRRWSQPLRVSWADLVGADESREEIRVRGFRVRTAPRVAIVLTEDAWARYRGERLGWLRIVDSLTQYNREHQLVLFKILDASASDIAEALDTVRWYRQRAAREQVADLGLHLSLGAGPDERGPLWRSVKGLREAPLDELPLTPGLVAELRDWNARGPGEKAGLDPSGTFDPVLLDAWSDEGKALAQRTQAELGSGAIVTFVYEVGI